MPDKQSNEYTAVILAKCRYRELYGKHVLGGEQNNIKILDLLSNS